MARNTVSVSALIAAAVAQGLIVTGTGRRVAQSQAVEYKAEPVKGKGKKAKAGLRQNERLKYTEGDDCCFCNKGKFKEVVKAQVGDNTRHRATFKGCKHTVNVY